MTPHTLQSILSLKIIIYQSSKIINNHDKTLNMSVSWLFNDSNTSNEDERTHQSRLLVYTTTIVKLKMSIHAVQYLL